MKIKNYPKLIKLDSNSIYSTTFRFKAFNITIFFKLNTFFLIKIDFDVPLYLNYLIIKEKKDYLLNKYLTDSNFNSLKPLLDTNKSLNSFYKSLLNNLNFLTITKETKEILNIKINGAFLKIGPNDNGTIISNTFGNTVSKIIGSTSYQTCDRLLEQTTNIICKNQ